MKYTFILYLFADANIDLFSKNEMYIYLWTKEIFYFHLAFGYEAR